MLAALLDKVSLGTPSAYRNLTLTPILLKDGPLSSVEPMSLEEALAAGTLRVSEVSAEGHVPELRVRNSGEAPVLILDGEELVGAKQNRIVNVTILVPPQSEIVIPVSCIEAGRWGYSRPELCRRGARAQPGDPLPQGRGGDQEPQGEAHALLRPARRLGWRRQDALRPRRGVADAGAQRRLRRARQRHRRFRWRVQTSTGAGWRPLSHRQTCSPVSTSSPRSAPSVGHSPSWHADRRSRPSLVIEKDVRPSLDEPGFLRAALTAPADRFPAVGLGEELRIDTDAIGGGALHLDGGLVHLFAFARPGRDKGPRAS